MSLERLSAFGVAVLLRSSRPQGAKAPASCLRRRRSRNDLAGAVPRRRACWSNFVPRPPSSSTFFCPTTATSLGISSSVFASTIDIRWLPTTGRLAVPCMQARRPEPFAPFPRKGGFYFFDGHARLPGFVRAASGAAPESHFLPERRLKPLSLEFFRLPDESSPVGKGFGRISATADRRKASICSKRSGTRAR
jgi:hypothetical protein